MFQNNIHNRVVDFYPGEQAKGPLGSVRMVPSCYIYTSTSFLHTPPPPLIPLPYAYSTLPPSPLTLCPQSIAPPFSLIFVPLVQPVTALSPNKYIILDKALCNGSTLSSILVKIVNNGVVRLTALVFHAH